MSRGGVCRSDSSAWPLSQIDLQYAVSQAGLSCTGTYRSAAETAPHIEDGVCYWAASASQISCNAFSQERQRLCSCLGAGPDPHVAAPDQSGTASGQRGADSGAQSGEAEANTLQLGGGDSASRSVADRSCRSGGFRPGQRNGGSQAKLAATYSSSGACRRAAVEHCPGANGVTYSPSLGECWCNDGMAGYVAQPTVETCWFEASSEVSRLWSLGGMLQELPVTGVVAMFVSAGAGGALSSIFVLRRMGCQLEGTRHGQVLAQDHSE